jgi:hypothetical protein
VCTCKNQNILREILEGREGHAVHVNDCPLMGRGGG